MQTKNFRVPDYILSVIRRKFQRLCAKIQWLIRKRPNVKVAIKRFRKLNPKSLSGHRFDCNRPIRISTFNVAMFSLAPAVRKDEESDMLSHEEEGYMSFRSPLGFGFQAMSPNFYPKSILKQSPLHTTLSNPESFCIRKRVNRSRQKVSINLPDNEISLAKEGSSRKVPVRSPICFKNGKSHEGSRNSRSILEVLKEVDADILALQDVKAQEENGMKPLSDLAGALGMRYVFAESWAPEYGNAVLTKWPIKRWKVQKIADDKDFRNVLMVTIDVPWAGEVNFHCTQLDHLDENWRMKQVNAIMQSNDSPHILAGGLNSLNGSDYSSERWMEIVKYYEDIGKPTPKMEVMRFLKGKEYIDAKEFAGECEPVVIIAKGQNVQGTCKYGTRVDYILGSQDFPYKFVSGSYSVISSKGTSDHHIVKADIVKIRENSQENLIRKHKKLKQKVVRITSHCSSKGVWKIDI